MNKKNPFLHKFIDKIDKVDAESVERYVRDFNQQLSLYRDIFDSLNEGILIYSEEGALTHFNRAAGDLLNLNESMIEKSKQFNWVANDEFRFFLEESADKAVKEITLYSPKNVTLKVHLKKLSELPSNQTLCIFENTTAIFQTQEWENRIQRIESLVQLASGIAHEIGNPLNSIGIHLQILKKQAVQLSSESHSKFSETLEIIESETKRLDKIIRDFLKATRKSAIRFKSENVLNILHESLHVMDPAIKKNKVEVEVIADETIPDFMLDRERLHQTFINLIKNALEAMPRGGSLLITAKKINKLLQIEFSDQGTGIDENDLPRIFDAYFTTKEEGSGLGLMSVYNAIMDHGGRVEVKSKLGKGTTFTLLIPIRQPKLQITSSHLRDSK